MKIYMSIFRKSVDKIQSSVYSDRYKACFTCRQTHVFDHISLISSKNEKCFAEDVEKIKTHVLISGNVCRKSCCLWDKGEKYRRAEQVTYDNMAYAGYLGL
jgi:hypothetical protein